MRGSLLVAVVALLLIPAGATAQRHPPDLGAIKRAPPRLIARDEAVALALARVRNDLVNDQLASWGGVMGGRIRPSALAASGMLLNPTGGRGAVYVVAVTAPNARGHVRVVVNAATGDVMAAELASFGWGDAPAWWREGEKAPPPPARR